MKTRLVYSSLTIAAALLAASPAKADNEVPEELRTPNYRITKLEGIGYDPKLTRQDPSNVIKVGDLYYVWYTQRQRGVHAYASTIYYATSKDGLVWKDKGEAIGKGEKGRWDSFGVITPYVGVFGGKYYLYYTGTSAEDEFQSRGPNGTLRHIGIAIADNPNGPWKKVDRNPVFSPVEGDNWENLLVDDAHIVARGGKYWLYYKGGHRTVKPSDTKWGLAIGDTPTGPFVRHRANPLIGGHTVCIWPHREGIAALIDRAGPESFSVQWSTDGVHFNRAARLKVVHTGCGPYDPDAFTDTGYGRGITWGVTQYPEKGTLCIIRFDVDFDVFKDARDARSLPPDETSMASLPLDVTTVRSAPANAPGPDDRQPTSRTAASIGSPTSLPPVLASYAEST